MDKFTGVYFRVSTADKQTPENQRVAVGEWLIAKGIEPNDCRVFEDMISGIRSARPGLDKLIADIKAGVISKVVVWRLDRLGRSLQHLIALMELMKEHKVEFVSLKEGFDTSTSAGVLMFNVCGAMAQFERDLISERVKMSIYRLRAQGKPVGRKKGSKDKRKRSKTGYFQRYAKIKEKERSLLGDKITLKELKKSRIKEQKTKGKDATHNLPEVKANV